MGRTIPDMADSSRSHLAPVWFQVTDLQVASGEGCWITTVDGERYLDFTSGIAVTSTGHCHPQVVAAIAEQAQRFVHAQVNCYRHDLLEPLAARLAELAPADIDTFFFANSGAEATEGAVKLAKQATGRPNVIVFQGSFHGRTHLAMAMTTSKNGYRAGHTPLPSGVFPAPFPHTVGTGLSEDEAVTAALDGVRYLLASQTAPAETAAMILEPVLGEGGYHPAPDSFMRGLREICDEHDVLLVSDETQFPAVLDMFEMLHGDLAARPFVLPYFNPVSPLVVNEGTADKLKVAVERGLPIIYSNYSMAGASTPLTPAGTLELRLTSTGRHLMGEVAQSRFLSLCKSIGVVGIVK